MPHAALCVSRLPMDKSTLPTGYGFNAARSIVCVETSSWGSLHLVARCFNAARSIVCVETNLEHVIPAEFANVSMPHAALCVSRRDRI